MGDFIPIDFLGSMHKILKKVLARRMTKFLNGFLSQYQNAFVKGCHILDYNLIANEVLDSRIKQGVGGMILKVDMMKACYHVLCNFLDFVLKEMGFEDKQESGFECVSLMQGSQ